MFWALKTGFSHIPSHTHTHSMHYKWIFDVLNIFCILWYQNVQDMDFIINLKVKY